MTFKVYKNNIEKWLYQHGGRGVKDLCEDDIGYYVWMSNRGIMEKIYI